MHVLARQIYRNGVSSYFRMMSIDMRSDTVTKPTQEMRAAMMNAVVGDDVYGDDPTVAALQEKVASILGKESALFFPSGTMANLASLMVHASRRGDEVIIGDRCHIGVWEQGGVAQLGGIFPRQVRNLDDGTLDLEELQSKIFPGGRDGHLTHTRLVCVENTHNYHCGAPIPVKFMEQLHAITSKQGIKIHVDGARLFNAATALNVEPSLLVQHADSVSICLSKGLGAPIGSLLAGTKEFIDQAHRVRKSLGGGMRQVGVLAAAGIVALDTIVPLLGADHRNAKLFAELLSNASHLGMKVDLKRVRSNMVVLSFDGTGLSAAEVVEKLENPKDPSTTHIVKVATVTEKTIRAVVYHQISEEQIRIAAKRVLEVLQNQ